MFIPTYLPTYLSTHLPRIRRERKPAGTDGNSEGAAKLLEEHKVKVAGLQKELSMEFARQSDILKQQRYISTTYLLHNLPTYLLHNLPS